MLHETRARVQPLDGVCISAFLMKKFLWQCLRGAVLGMPCPLSQRVRPQERIGCGLKAALEEIPSHLQFLVGESSCTNYQQTLGVDCMFLKKFKT